ncbi:MAG: hypothetical protein P4M11_15250 [Candidatus Pacebacteria bacterium]|nr:hypothetical protein [Candidatus Paceibacterota bacterium]
MAVVHCEAGKGRTGTVIASALVFGGYMDKAEDALDFYGRKRFSDRLGVSQPSQRRYVNYLEDVYKQKVISPMPKELKKLVIGTRPVISKFKPYFQIFCRDAKTLVSDFPMVTGVRCTLRRKSAAQSKPPSLSWTPISSQPSSPASQSTRAPASSSAATSILTCTRRTRCSPTNSSVAHHSTPRSFRGPSSCLLSHLIAFFGSTSMSWTRIV